MATSRPATDNEQVLDITQSIDENQSVVKTQHTNNESGVDKPNSSTNAPPTTPSRLEKTFLSASTDIVTELQQLRDLVTLLTNEVEIEKTKAQIYKDDFDNERRDRTMAHDQHEQDVFESKLIIESLKKQLAETEQVTNNFQTVIVDLHYQIAVLKQENIAVENTRESIQEDEKARMNWKEEQSGINQQLRAYKRQVDDLRSKLTEEKEKNEKLQETTDGKTLVKDEIMRCNVKIHDLQLLIDHLQEDMEKMRNANMRLQHKLCESWCTQAKLEQELMDKNAAGKQQKKHNFIVQQKQRLVDYQLQEQRLRQLEEESKREQEAADLALQQLAAAKLKRGRLLQQQGNRLPPPTQKFERGDEEDVSIPFDPNLICPMCGKQFRVGEIQILRLHINNLCSEELDDEFSDRDKENSYMERNNTQSETNILSTQKFADDIRRMTQLPRTEEVERNDDDSSIPQDPNLICPKCGKIYRIGEIQKLNRHVNEFCKATESS